MSEGHAIDTSSDKRFRVWCEGDFKECKTDDERDELAWEVPPERGIFNPEMVFHCEDPEEAARKYAEHYYDDDGHESSWPLVFVVHDGRTYYRISVDLDYAPTFHSSDPEEFTP